MKTKIPNLVRTTVPSVKSKSTPTQSKRLALRPVFGVTLAVALWAISVPARGDQLFVSSDNGFATLGSVGAYNLDGTPVNASLIPEGSLYLPQQMTTFGTNLFIVDASGNNSIGEYTASGAPVNASLVTGLNSPSFIAVSGTNLFVANNGNGSVYEYTLGTTPGTVTSTNTSFITGLNGPEGLVVSGGNLFVANNASGTIGEYTTSGATVSNSLISGLTSPLSLAVSGSYLFVLSTGKIGEYTTSGAIVNSSLITGLGGNEQSIVVDGSQLFVNERGDSDGNGSVYEYTLGTNPGTVISTNTSFITGLYEPTGLAIAFSVPPLGIGTLGNQTVVFWPGTTANFVLQSTTNLASPNWVTASNGTPFNAVGFTNSSPARFFRLQQQ